jgi:hypothetical protein
MTNNIPFADLLYINGADYLLERRQKMSIQFVATIAGVNGPVAENEQEAVVRLTEYMQSAIGKRHFHDANPDKSEEQYQETLFQLYARESEKEISVEEVSSLPIDDIV